MLVSGIRTRDPSNPAAADLRHGLHGCLDRLYLYVFNYACTSTIDTLSKFCTSIIKVEVKVTLEQVMKAQRGVDDSPTLSLTSTLNGGGWSSPRLGRFSLGKDPVPGTGGWVDPRAHLDGCGKSRPPPGFDPRTVQPVASRFHD